MKNEQPKEPRWKKMLEFDVTNLEKMAVKQARAYDKKHHAAFFDLLVVQMEKQRDLAIAECRDSD